MTDEDRYLEALRQIADEACGIPGHAVAVGCRSSWLAMMALDPNCHEECSKCRGSKTQERSEWQKAWHVNQDGSKGEEVDLGPTECDWCRGTGRQLKDHIYGEPAV